MSSRRGHPAGRIAGVARTIGAPFFITGTLKISYDLPLYRTSRHRTVA